MSLETGNKSQSRLGRTRNLCFYGFYALRSYVPRCDWTDKGGAILADEYDARGRHLPNTVRKNQGGTQFRTARADASGQPLELTASWPIDDGLQTVTKTFYPPFTKVDREEDYQRAWDVFELEPISTSSIPELATTIVAGGGAAILVNLITFSGSSWLLWTTTTSAATVAGGLIGVSAGIATAGIGAAAGLGAGVTLNQAMKKRRRRKIKTGILESFDEEVVPSLEEWADEQIATVVN